MWEELCALCPSWSYSVFPITSPELTLKSTLSLSRRRETLGQEIRRSWDLCWRSWEGGRPTAVEQHQCSLEEAENNFKSQTKLPGSRRFRVGEWSEELVQLIHPPTDTYPSDPIISAANLSSSMSACFSSHDYTPLSHQPAPLLQNTPSHSPPRPPPTYPFQHRWGTIWWRPSRGWSSNILVPWWGLFWIHCSSPTSLPLEWWCHIIYLLHQGLTHLETPGSTMKIMFFNFSSAFNIIQPGHLREKLELSGVDLHLSQWMLDYLTGCPQYVRSKGWPCRKLCWHCYCSPSTLQNSPSTIQAAIYTTKVLW